jgi:hypothetical protein
MAETMMISFPVSVQAASDRRIEKGPTHDIDARHLASVPTDFAGAEGIACCNTHPSKWLKNPHYSLAHRAGIQIKITPRKLGPAG